MFTDDKLVNQTYEPRLGKRAIIAYTNSKGSGEPAYLHSLARANVVYSRKRYAKDKLQPKNLTTVLSTSFGKSFFAWRCTQKK